MKTRLPRLGGLGALALVLALSGCGREERPGVDAAEAERRAADAAHNARMEEHVKVIQPRILGRIARAKAELAKAEAEKRPAAELAMLTNQVRAAFAELENDQRQAQREVRAHLARANAAKKSLNDEQKKGK